MYQTATAMVLLLSIFSLFISCDVPTKNKQANESTASESKEIASQEKLLRHVVLFKFNESATDEIVTQIEIAFAQLPDQISEIHSFEWGVNNSPEGLDKGLTHCFLVSFLSEADRDAYIPHTAHQKFVQFIGPYVSDATVVDYWAL